MSVQKPRHFVLAFPALSGEKVPDTAVPSFRSEPVMRKRVAAANADPMRPRKATRVNGKVADVRRLSATK